MSQSSHEILARTFDDWAATGRDESMEREHGDVVRQVIPRLHIRAGEQVLDLGCGNGWATRLLARAAPGVSAVGVDVSPAMVAQAERVHSLTIRARYEIAAFEALPFSNARFDRIFSMEALYYAVDLERTLAEMLRMLKPGAPADVVIDYYQDNPATACWPDITKVPMQSFSQTDWHAQFERAGFTNLRTERVVDSRGPGDPAEFKPSCCYPDWNTWLSVRSAGSLWIHGEKA